MWDLTYKKVKKLTRSWKRKCTNNVLKHHLYIYYIISSSVSLRLLMTPQSVRTIRGLPWITPSCGPALTPSGIGGNEIHCSMLNSYNNRTKCAFDCSFWQTVAGDCVCVCACLCGGVCLGVTHMRISVSWLVVYMPGLACRRTILVFIPRSQSSSVCQVCPHACLSLWH